MYFLVPVDTQSTTDENQSRTEGSSIDLEWEHEEGLYSRELIFI